MRWPLRTVWMAGALFGMAAGVHADRIVLAPRGLVAPTGSINLELASMASDDHRNVGFIDLGPFRPDMGLELEAEGVDIGHHGEGTFSLQYTLTGNAFSDIAPAVSVGVRDVLNQGLERRAFYVAATKTIGLSLAQEHVVRDMKVDLGYGSSRLDGVFAGLEARFTIGAAGRVEVVGRRINAELGIPAGRLLQLRVYSLSGRMFYGAGLAIRR